MKIRIIDLLKTTTYNINVSVNGWVRTHRQSKNISFIAINDGSTVHNLQIVAEHEKIKKDFLKLVTTGSAIRVDGMICTIYWKSAAWRNNSPKYSFIWHCRPTGISFNKRKNTR